MNPAQFRKISFSHRGFTLIELMMVIFIMGLFLAAGLPSLYRLWHKQGLAKSVNEIVEVCNNARARAILQGKATKVVFHPKEGRCELADAPAPQSQSKAETESEKSLSGLNGSTVSARLANGIAIEMLDVAQHEYKDAEAVYVWFFPNGTSDEMILILRSDNHEWRKISLEVTTGLSSVEIDPQKFGR